MPKRIDITGNRFGSLLVSGYSHTSSNSKIYWGVKCDCGTEKKVRGEHLRGGLIVSCGCYGKLRRTTHGQSFVGKVTRVYRTWRNMNKRCNNPNTPEYKHYGGRGITICERWSTFESFFADMGEPPSNRHSIDRIDNNGNYEPSNCRWASPTEQANNTSQNVFIEFRDKKQTVAQWARELKITRSTLFKRIKKWDLEKALTEPKQESYDTSISIF